MYFVYECENISSPCDMPEVKKYIGSRKNILLGLAPGVIRQKWFSNLWTTITQCRSLSKDDWHKSFCPQPKFCPAHLQKTETWRKIPLRGGISQSSRHNKTKIHWFCLATLKASLMIIFFKNFPFIDSIFSKNRGKNYYGIKGRNLAFCHPISKRQRRIREI